MQETWVLIPGSGSSPGEENSYPLRYPCLLSPMDRGAWWPKSMGSIKCQALLQALRIKRQIKVESPPCHFSFPVRGMNTHSVYQMLGSTREKTDLGRGGAVRSSLCNLRQESNKQVLNEKVTLE